MTEKNQTLLVHAVCIMVICCCVGLSLLPQLAATPLVGHMLIGAATLLYGKLCFKPASPVLNRIIAKLEPERVEMIMSTRPPAGGEP